MCKIPNELQRLKHGTELIIALNKHYLECEKCQKEFGARKRAVRYV